MMTQTFTALVSFFSQHVARSRKGSALLVTLLCLSLLIVMVLAFVAVVRMDLRKVVAHQEGLQARAHARLSLEMAVARLQETAGADQRVTGTAALEGHTRHPHWTGVWPSAGGNATWLVSGGETVNPGANLPPDSSMVMVPADPEAPGSAAVRVPLIPLPGTEGRYGWWVGDEGVKARVDVVASELNAPAARERKLRSQAPGHPDMLSLGAPWNEGTNADLFARDGNGMRGRLVSRDTLGMAVQNVPTPTLFHDLTVHGYGLPVNVREGGLKADWSVVLDQSMENTPLVDHYMGARPTTCTRKSRGS